MNEINPAVGARIKSLRQEKGLTLEQVSKALGVSRMLISYIERGQRYPGHNTLESMCDFYGVSMDYITCRSDTREETVPEALPSVQPIPVYSCISCGTGLWVQEQPEAFTGAPDWMLRAGQDYFANPAEGDSMEPLIENGDCLIFSRTSMLRSGQIGAFSLNGAYYCKKYYQDAKGRHWLISENRDYAPILIRPEDDFHVLGLYKLRITKSGQ